MSGQEIYLKDYRHVFDGFVKQTGTYATLVAGFAFAILAFVSYESSATRQLTTSFIVCVSTTIVLEILSSFIFNILSLVTRVGVSDNPFETFWWQLKVAWYAYLLGLYIFLASLALLAWIKFKPAAVVVTVLVSIALVLGVVITASIVIKSNRLARETVSRLNSPR
jgi:hypothetical protein